MAAHAGVTTAGAWLELADARVTSADIVRLRLGADLVVVSSCASANSRDPGRIGSLASAFIAAGAHAVVATLWSVTDESARQLVEAFYTNGGAESPAVALARAQVQSAQTRPPSAWAAFILVTSLRSNDSL